MSAARDNGRTPLENLRSRCAQCGWPFFDCCCPVAALMPHPLGWHNEETDDGEPAELNFDDCGELGGEG